MTKAIQPGLSRILEASYNKKSELITLAVDNTSALSGLRRLPALDLTLAYMRATHGLVATYPFFNLVYGPYEYNLTMTATEPTWQRVDPFFSYGNYVAASTTYLYTTNANFDVQSTVGDWNPEVGLAIGGWFRLSSLFSGVDGNYGLVTKWKADGDPTRKEYRLFFRGRATTVYNLFRFDVSSDGSTTEAVAEGTIIPEIDRWYMVIGRWVPGTETKLYVYDKDGIVETISQTTSVPSGLYAGGTGNQFRIGSYVDSTSANNPLDGDACLVFMTKSWVTDEWVQLFYEISRELVLGGAS